MDNALAKRVQHFIKHTTTRGGQTNATFHTTRYNISSKIYATEYNKVAWVGQTSATSYNIPENKRNVLSYNICLSPGQTSTTFHRTSYSFDVVWNVALVWPPCCIMLYRVVFCCMKFDCDQTFSPNKCCTIQHFFCFPGCCMMLYSFRHPMQFCPALFYSRVCSRSNFPATFLCWLYFWRHLESCCTKCCICLADPPLNTIKQHATIWNKCCIMFYEMFYSFGQGFSEKVWSRSNFINKIQHDTTRWPHFIQHRSCMMSYEMLYSFGRGFKGNWLILFLI